MLDQITPVILTYNEEANIRRTLEALRWARTVIVLDSLSEDETCNIAGEFNNVRIFQRAFDTHARQWNYAIHNTDISTEWVLRLDADYYVTGELLDEINELGSSEFDAYIVSFQYAVLGKIIRNSVYPPNTILFKKALAEARDEGHTERWEICGRIGRCKHYVIHDDRKTIGRWLQSQSNYMAKEVETLDNAGLKARIRRVPLLAPICIMIYLLLYKRLIFDGLPGLYYALQRVIAEAILNLYAIQKKCDSPPA